MSTLAKMSTAYHESGHYIVNFFSGELIERNVRAVSIMPAEDYLGVNVFEIDRDMTPSQNKRYYIQLIGSMLGGRVAEKMCSSQLTAGAFLRFGKESCNELRPCGRDFPKSCL